MKQFSKILKFELKNYFSNKVFVGVTLFLVAAIAVTMFFPRIKGVFVSNKDGQGRAENNGSEAAQGERDDERPVMLLSGEYVYTGGADEVFADSFPDYEIKTKADEPLDSIKAQIKSGEAKCAFVLDGPTSYTYYVDNLSMYDNNTMIADELLLNIHRVATMLEHGMSLEEADAVLSVQITHETESLGKDQMKNFFYTYIMIFALYMVILLYGQMVATNVAAEKSSRAMELLITSAKPTSMMFGKVAASCLAGFIQIAAVFGSALLFYHINKGYWGDNMVIDSLFNMPALLVVYMLLFFVLGFLIYAFMYGAVGSTVSKLEDINTAVMPITLIFIAAFLVVVFSMSSGNVDNIIIKVCSFIPFTSPMAMFTRIAMSTVPFYEIFVSVVLLIGTAVGIGFISAKIYRVGVLLYGTRPKIGNILKAMRNK